jgi:DNA-binding HxlR family transcriptional regulator
VTLKQLIAKEMITREVNSNFPVSVVYSLTQKGAEMKAVMTAMREWGEKWINT